MAHTRSTPLARLRKFLKERELDGVLLRTRRNFSWMTGGKVNYIEQTSERGVADLLIFDDAQYCVTTKMEFARIHNEELHGLGYTFITPEWYEGTEAAIRKLCAGKAVGTDVPFAELELVEADLASLRYRLSADEIERYRILSQKTAHALEATCREMMPGWTEHEIAAHLAAKVIKEGIRPSVLLVATDERIFNYRHPIPTDKRLEKYAMVVLCGEKWGLISNATRLVHFGALPEELVENKQKLATIDTAMCATTRPGTSVKHIFQVALDTYDQVGHTDDWRYLHLGGATGYAGREYFAGPQSTETVHINQAFAWNPAIRGVKSEDTMLVKEEGNEFLTFTGEWDYIEVERDGIKYLRPDILVRSI